MPFTSFSEYDTMNGKKMPVWFAPDESRSLLRFAGPNWTSVRKAKEGEVLPPVWLPDLRAAEGGRVHRKAMPVILTAKEEPRRLATRVVGRGQGVQRALPDGSLKIVASGAGGQAELAV